MAFIRSEKRGTEIYLSICETERDGKKVVQKRLYNLGKLSDYSEASLRRMGERLYEMGGGNLEDLMYGMCKEIARYNYGFPLIINYLFKIYKLDDYFVRLQTSGKQSYPIRDVIVLLMCNRWSSPLSKLGVYDTQSDYYGLAPISLQWIYRSLDKLAKKSVSLQEFYIKRTLNCLIMR